MSLQGWGEQDICWHEDDTGQFLWHRVEAIRPPGFGDNFGQLQSSLLVTQGNTVLGLACKPLSQTPALLYRGRGQRASGLIGHWL